ncbi:PLP-dependent aminotransferase family protein [Marinobacterium sp. D7]|uniref:aminotransferase-like domain-containing protein n=1 Tax=Marinobacterium ramblicola TaxID=2849041 RepID=UPI001C2DE6C1|nr:PLP-dependent aminotransferase family protein [Marinobacterium ramblicola]MBV1787255.1 PLP-dependent aminotransferase family protein [Marinobacterium ramblicola]
MKLYEELAEYLQRSIEQGLYAGGDRMPSIRTLVREHGVSVTTVQEAYRQLEDAGLVESRPKSGYFARVRCSAPDLPRVGRPVRRPVEVSKWEDVLHMLGAETPSKVFSLGHAMPDFTGPTLKPLLKLWSMQARRSDMRGLEYDSLKGTEELRTQVARLGNHSGCQLDPDELIITTGCQEALFCALRAVTEPGDVVAVDSPCFYGAMQAIKANDLRVMEIPTHAETGLSLEALELALEQWPIKAVVVTPTCNNPLGYTMPESRKRALLLLAQRFDIAIIEDDIYGDLSYAWPRPRTIKAFDADGRVLLCSSFSKTLAPGLRLGWIAPGRYRSEVIHNKFVSTAASSTLSQLAVAQFIAEGGYERHLRKMRAQYQRNRDLMVNWLEQHFPAGMRISYPQGGYLLWLEFGQEVDCVELNRELSDKLFRIAPGVLFSASGKYRNCMRLNFINGLDGQTEEALLTLAAMIEQRYAKEG